MKEGSRFNGKSTRGKPFQKGNPGRPRGARHKSTLAIEALLEGEGEKLARKAVDMALAGDPTALRLVMERIAPVRKGRTITFDLPKAETAEDLAAALGSVLEHVASGDLTPDEAASVASIVETRRRVLETVELERRLTALEGTGAKP